MLLLDYEQFQFIKILCKNRWTVLYCTMLAKTEGEAAKKEIEEEMKADPEKAAVLKVWFEWSISSAGVSLCLVFRRCL